MFKNLIQKAQFLCYFFVCFALYQYQKIDGLVWICHGSDTALHHFELYIGWDSFTLYILSPHLC